MFFLDLDVFFFDTAMTIYLLFHIGQRAAILGVYLDTLKSLSALNLKLNCCDAQEQLA